MILMTSFVFGVLRLVWAVGAGTAPMPRARSERPCCCTAS
jgi:hypothetical protein